MPNHRNIILPSWGPRIKPYLIRRLYEGDAQGMLDLDLLEEVGWALYARCESFIQAGEARQGHSRCPACKVVIEHGIQSRAVLCCPACGWESTWKKFNATIRNQQLDGGQEVIALFQGYLLAFPKAKQPTEKMLLIDGLIHGFHHFLRSGRTRRPVWVNLISGHLDFVMRFLDELSVGSGSTPGLQESQRQWQEKIKGLML